MKKSQKRNLKLPQLLPKRSAIERLANLPVLTKMKEKKRTQLKIFAIFFDYEANR